MNDVYPGANPALPQRSSVQRNVLAVIFIALIYAVQAECLLWVIPNFARVFADRLRPSPAHSLGAAGHALPALTALVLKISSVAVHFKYPTILLCATLAAGTLWLFFNGRKTHRLLAILILVSLFLLTLLEVFAMFLPMMAIYKSLGHK